MRLIRNVLVALGAFVMASSVMFADSERAISFDQLPKKAQDYVKKYFPESEVSYVREEKDVLEVNYEVVLSDGVKLDFDRKGDWDEVEARYSELKESVVPVQIRTYVEKNYPGSKYRKISRDRRGYDLELVSGLELEFDMEFRFLRVDD